MGFLDNLGNMAGKAAKSVIDDTNKRVENIQKYKAMYEDYDDSKLISKYKSSSGDEKMACGQLLKERGYGNN
jgi:hypothetical protein